MGLALVPVGAGVDRVPRADRRVRLIDVGLDRVGQAESAALAIQFELSGAYLRVQGLLDDATDDLDDVRESNLLAI